MRKNSTHFRRELLGGLATISVGKLAGVNTLHAEPGEVLWRFETGNEGDTSPAVVGGIVNIGSNDCNMYGLTMEGSDGNEDDTDGSTDKLTSGFDIGGDFAGFGDAGYLLKRRQNGDTDNN